MRPGGKLDKPDQCTKDSDQLEFIKEWKEKSRSDDCEKEVAFLEKKISVAQADHESLLSSLQAQFDESQKKLASTKSELTGKITLLNMVATASKSDKTDKSEL